MYTLSYRLLACSQCPKSGVDLTLCGWSFQKRKHVLVFSNLAMNSDCYIVAGLVPLLSAAYTHTHTQLTVDLYTDFRLKMWSSGRHVSTTTQIH